MATSTRRTSEVLRGSEGASESTVEQRAKQPAVSKRDYKVDIKA